MKIAKLGEGKAKAAPRYKPNRSNRPKTKFINRVSQARNDLLEKEFGELWQDVQDAEKRVRHSLSYPDWVEYRKSIYDLLSFVKQTGYHKGQKEGISAGGRPYAHTIITAIDEKIHEVSTAFLRKSKDRIALLGKLDELRGKLLDLYA